MNKKLLQYYQSKMNDGGKILPKYQSKGWFDSVKEDLKDLFGIKDEQPKQVTLTMPQNISIKDTRKTSRTTGKAINPNIELVSGDYPSDRIFGIVKAAKRYGIDPYTALAIDMQETGLGKRSDARIGHNKMNESELVPSRMEGEEGAIDPYDYFTRALLTKMQYADKLGITDPYVKLQAYNGLGKVFPKTEKKYHGFEMDSIYGVPLNKQGIDLRRNPLYGKRVSDIRDNVLMTNPDLKYWIPHIKKQGGPIEDSRGQWAHPGEVTRIPSSKITMQGVPYPVYGVGSNGKKQMMYPNQEYDFGNAKHVDEFPIMQGGGLWNTNKKAWVDSIHNARRGDLDFVQRFFDPKYGSIPTPRDVEGWRPGQSSTHLMADDPGSRRVFPTVVNINGKLKHLPGYDEAWNYADDTKQFIEFPTAEQARWYADSPDSSRGYKMGTGVLKNITPKGKPTTKYQIGGENEREEYIIKSGDTLNKIAKQYGTTSRKIAEANNISNPNMIRINQKLILPAQPKPRTLEYQDWNAAKQNLDRINALPDEQLLNQYYSSRPEEGYLVVDKKNARMNYYKGDKLIKSYEVGTGENPGDAQTVTRINPATGKADWNAGNKSTGAGVYSISNIDPASKEYYGLPSFNMTNDQGIEVATSIHGTPVPRRVRFGNNNIEDNRMSNGCINGRCEDLPDMFNRFDVGNKIYILPEDEGNRFQIVDGKPVLKVPSANRAKYNQYIDKTGKTQKGQGVNQSVNTLAYSPIRAVFDDKNFRKNVFTAFDPNDEEEYKNTTVPYYNALVNNKKQIMQAAQIPSDIYNELAKMSFGIYGAESNYGDDNNAANNFVRAIRKVKPLSSAFQSIINLKPTLVTDDQMGGPDVKSKGTTYGANKNKYSVGYTQIRWNELNDHEKEVLKKLGVTSNKDFLNPEKAAIATTAILGVRYNEQLNSEQKKDLWKHLPKTWNKRGNYPARVKENSKYLNFQQLMKDGGSLDRTVTCSNCGWSWKLSDGGKDPMTCHRCGGQIKMKEGGQTNNDREMLEGVADMLRRVKDEKNRKEIANYMMGNFREEDVSFKPKQFLEESNVYKYGGEMIRRADGSYSRRGLWDNIRANKGSGKAPTKEMLQQERKIKAKNK
jgi:LysM repeat protein